MDDIWPEIVNQVPVLGLDQPIPDFFTRQCTSEQGENVLRNHYAMPSNVYTVRAGPSPINIEGIVYIIIRY